VRQMIKSGGQDAFVIAVEQGRQEACNSLDAIFYCQVSTEVLRTSGCHWMY